MEKLVFPESRDNVRGSLDLTTPPPSSAGSLMQCVFETDEDLSVSQLAEELSSDLDEDRWRSESPAADGESKCVHSVGLAGRPGSARVSSQSTAYNKLLALPRLLQHLHHSSDDISETRSGEDGSGGSSLRRGHRKLDGEVYFDALFWFIVSMTRT